MGPGTKLEDLATFSIILDTVQMVVFNNSEAILMNYLATTITTSDGNPAYYSTEDGDFFFETPKMFHAYFLF